MKKPVFGFLVLFILLGCSSNHKEISISNGNAQEAKAEAEYNKGNYQKSAELYANIANDIPDAEGWFKYAESLRLSGNVQEAKKKYDKALDKDEKMLPALEGKSLCYVSEGKFKDAQNLLEEVINNDSSRWRSLNALGVIYAMNGDLAKSMQYYSQALEISKNNPAVLNNMALSVTLAGDAQRGKKLLERTLSNVDLPKEKKQKIEYNLALIYGISGDMDKAKSILSQYLPEPAVYNNLGVYAKMAKNDELAKQYLSKALASSPVYYEKAGKNLENIKF